MQCKAQKKKEEKKKDYRIIFRYFFAHEQSERVLHAFNVIFLQTRTAAKWIRILNYEIKEEHIHLQPHK